ncbi:MAG: gamma-glutamyltranspeptidase/glutathione hydrolase [Flavobacteriales bacterium]|jgi:gamma-glutamyltranspeptidase/glutathione hydrolase
MFPSVSFYSVSVRNYCAFALVLIFAVPPITLMAEQPYAAVTPDNKAAVATVNPIATNIGLDVYKNGGNAVDAAFAIAFALGVVDSHNSGIGGGCFIVAHLADGTVVAIDGREMAPSAAHRDMYLRDGVYDPKMSRLGPLAVGVPGSVAALYELLDMAGTMSPAALIEPSAIIADRGFAIDAVLAKRLQSSQKSLKLFPESAKIYLPGGRLLKQGDTLIQKDLARTYRQLAKQGEGYFYRGDFAKNLTTWMKKSHGLITEKDLKAYRVLKRKPVISAFNGYTIYGFPPPSSGGAHIAQILNILEAADAAKLPELERYHLFIEASKRAFADRAHWMADADFAKVPLGLIEKEYAKALLKTIDGKASEGVSYGLPPNYKTELFNKHTTHLVTADKLGNWVSITTSLNTSFGSKAVVPGTGVLMNNQMDDFSAQPGKSNAYGLVGSEANRIESGKRPLSSMSPSLVMRDEKPVMVLGAAGGPTIISQVYQTLFNHLALKQGLFDSLSAVRVHQQWKPGSVFIDGFADKSLQDGLRLKGHDLKVWPKFGGTQAISYVNGKWEVESEPRIQ